MMKTDNNRFLFPHEYKEMLKLITDKRSKDTKVLIELQFHTGARFDELLHVRPRDFDFDRATLHLWKTKTKAKKGEKVGKPRTIVLEDKFAKKMQRFVKTKKWGESLFKISQAGYNQLIKAKLKKAGLEHWKEFSSHNIRKTHGNYLKALNVQDSEICLRLGHDMNTFIGHYGSASIFNDSDMREIRNLLGDLPRRLGRRY